MSARDEKRRSLAGMSLHQLERMTPGEFRDYLSAFPEAAAYFIETRGSLVDPRPAGEKRYRQYVGPRPATPKIQARLPEPVQPPNSYVEWVKRRSVDLFPGTLTHPDYEAEHARRKEWARQFHATHNFHRGHQGLPVFATPEEMFHLDELARRRRIAEEKTVTLPVKPLSPIPHQPRHPGPSVNVQRPPVRRAPDLRGEMPTMPGRPRPYPTPAEQPQWLKNLLERQRQRDSLAEQPTGLPTPTRRHLPKVRAGSPQAQRGA